MKQSKYCLAHKDWTWAGIRAEKLEIVARRLEALGDDEGASQAWQSWVGANEARRAAEDVLLSTLSDGRPSDG